MFTAQIRVFKYPVYSQLTNKIPQSSEPPSFRHRFDGYHRFIK